MDQRKEQPMRMDEYVNLPRIINSDKDYIVELKKTLADYNIWIRHFLNKQEGIVKYINDEQKSKICKQISKDCEIINNCVYTYNYGNVVKAAERIYNLLDRIIKSDQIGFVKSDLDKSYCCRMSSCYEVLLNKNVPDNAYDNLKNEDLTFFRARKNFYPDYKEMYHIPLDKRDIVGTERFSIPGVPCLYLGCSVYDTWIELGRPAYSQFNVSAVKLKEEGKKLQILNLVVSLYLINGINKIGVETDVENLDKMTALLITLLRVYPLVVATSIRNKNPNVKFRSDYIISHLIMMNLKKLGIDGVAYVSKRIEGNSEIIAIPQMVNIALPAFSKSSCLKEYSDVCEKIIITSPVNYEEFLSFKTEGNVKNSFFAKTVNQTGLELPIECIPMIGNIIDYHNTIFYKFENYVCGLAYHSLENCL